MQRHQLPALKEPEKVVVVMQAEDHIHVLQHPKNVIPTHYSPSGTMSVDDDESVPPHTHNVLVSFGDYKQLDVSHNHEFIPAAIFCQLYDMELDTLIKMV